MKLLVYGGCHAKIIKRLIDELGPPGRHSVDCLINFKLVERGEPFPYHRLPDYDAIVFSPVENKGEHNTCHLDAACAAAGVPAIRFPWLEWHGYAPGADKAVFWGHHCWFYPGLIEFARDFRDLDVFIREARGCFPSDETIRDVSAFSTHKLADQETRIGCEVQVSDFILNRFREQRMFLVSDHPALSVYRHVLDQIERLLGQRLIAAWPDELPEPQPEEMTPILPRVAAGMRLSPSVADAAWRCETQPVHAMSLDGYLAMHFFYPRRTEPGGAWDAERQSGLAVATATCRSCVMGTRPVAARPGDDARSQATEAVETATFDQLLLRREGPADARGLFTAEVVAALGTATPTARLLGRRQLRGEDWTCRS